MATRKETRTVAGPELIFGLVAPVGADLEAVTDELRRALALVGYQTTTLRLSVFAKNLSITSMIIRTPEIDYAAE